MVNSAERGWDSLISQRECLLGCLSRSVNHALAGKCWASARIDMFVSSARLVIYKSSFANHDDAEMTKFRFSLCESQEMERAIWGLYELGLSNKDERWNKARYELYLDRKEFKNCHKFDFYFDSDYQWLTTLEPESCEYESLLIEDELAIETWGGLALDHSRPWQNRRSCDGVLNG